MGHWARQQKDAVLAVDGSSGIGESRAEPRGVRRFGKRRSAGGSQAQEVQVLGSARQRCAAGGGWPLGWTQRNFTRTLSSRRARAGGTGVRVRGWGNVTPVDFVFGSAKRWAMDRHGSSGEIPRGRLRGNRRNNDAECEAGHYDLSVHGAEAE
jgi:hypothetical protein